MRAWGRLVISLCVEYDLLPVLKSRCVTEDGPTSVAHGTIDFNLMAQLSLTFLRTFALLDTSRSAETRDPTTIPACGLWQDLSGRQCRWRAPAQQSTAGRQSTIVPRRDSRPLGRTLPRRTTPFRAPNMSTMTPKPLEIRGRQVNTSVCFQEGRVGQSRNKRDEQWDARFKELLEYRLEHGDCDVPNQRGKLGKWVSHQRTAYRAGLLERDRIDRLNGIGFKWLLINVGPNVPWETRFDELVQYKAEHGDCNVPQSRGKLGTWVSKQRQQYNNDKLSQDRIDRLNGIGFNWTSPRAKFRNRKALPSSYEQSSIRHEIVPLLSISTNGGSVSAAAGENGFDSSGVKVKDSVSGPVLSLTVPSDNSSCIHGTECDDEDDEIGALIYEHVMQRKRGHTRGAPGCFPEH